MRVLTVWLLRGPSARIFPPSLMAKYEVGKEWFFPILGRKAIAGEVIELPEDAAAIYMRNDPGIIKPVRRTTQAHAEAVRSEEPQSPVESTVEEPKSVQRRRKK